MSEDELKYLSEGFSGEQFKLVKQKGIYPYEYMNSFEKFSEEKLPDKKHFYSSLKGRHINDNYFLHAVKVWNALDMKNMGEYHDNYLKIDVLLLADIFEKFVDWSLKIMN